MDQFLRAFADGLAGKATAPNTVENCLPGQAGFAPWFQTTDGDELTARASRPPTSGSTSPSS